MEIPHIHDILDIVVDSPLAEQGLYYGRICTASATAIILYEHLITFEDELRLIWGSRWSTGKVLFLISRYYNIFTIIFNSYSFAWFRWQAASGVLVYGITEIILMLRLYAMYSESKKVLSMMVIGFGAVLITEIIILVLSTLAQIGAVNATPHLQISMASCILTDTWKLSYLYWIPFLVFETFLFILALIKGYQSYHNQELSFKRGSLAVKALEVLIRDSILFFLLIFAVYVANFTAWVVESGRIGEIPVAFCVAISTVMAQRLLLNIRENFERQAAGGAGDGRDSFQLSTMVYDGLLLSGATDETRAGTQTDGGQSVGLKTMMSGSTAVGSPTIETKAAGSSTDGCSSSPASPVSLN